MKITAEKKSETEYYIALDAVEFTLLDVGELRNHIEAHCFAKKIFNISIDMEKVKYIDSGGLGFFLGLYKKLKANEGKLLMLNTQSQIETTLKMTKLDAYLKST